MVYERRGRKALAPWCFRPGFVRRQVKAGDRCDANPSVPEASESTRQETVDGGIGGSESTRQETVDAEIQGSESTLQETVDGGILGSESGGGSGDRESERIASDGSTGVLKGGTDGAAGRGCNLEGLGGNAAATESNVIPKYCNLGETPDGNGVSRTTDETAKPGNLQGFQCNGTAAEINSAAIDCKSEGLRTGDGAVPGYRRGRKAVVTWRFQVGYKRPRSQGVSLDNESDGHPETIASMFRDGSKQCASAMRSNRSRVRVSATSNQSSLKIQRETASVRKKKTKKKKRKKMKFDADDHQQTMADNRDGILTLREFRIIYRKLREDEKLKFKKQGNGLTPELAAFEIFKEKLNAQPYEMRYVGSVDGVQVGDVFDFSVELCVVGLHRSQLACVDYIEKEDGTCLAVSIVSFAKPSALNNNLEFLLHWGSTTATIDQKIEGTDLALKQSMDTGTPVRVIHGFVTDLDGNSHLGELRKYVYGGLYAVEKFCREKVSEDQYVHTFHLKRKSGQPQVNIQELAESRKPEQFDGIFMLDISEGLEKIPISVINSISDECPTPFCYISQIQYPPKYQTDLPSGCDCVDGCSNSQECACAVKNGRESPFNGKGALIDGRPLVYECGPSCKCPPTCGNRVSQHGIKFRLQVFKTKSMGWGVRTLDFIPEGSFVCEYTGHVLDDDEAERRGNENDEYLFAIGNNYYDTSRWGDMPKTIPSLQNGPRDDEEEVKFNIDGLNCGNVSRFINHSCDPNLFSQNILYDHDNKSMPHIMFFAGVSILPLQHLSYDYNYTVDGVHDSDGNIKKKECLCGSIYCTGRLY